MGRPQQTALEQVLLFAALLAGIKGAHPAGIGAAGQQAASDELAAGNALLDWVRAEGGEVLPCDMMGVGKLS
jgi:hypothetical protein